MSNASPRVLSILVILLSFTLWATAQKAEGQLPIDPNVKIGKLPNGLTYYIQKNPKPENKVELRLAINAGSVLEEEGQQGLAHFMEHMGFNGSKNFPKNELVNYLQKTGVKFGADLNAYTSFDETVYILPIPSSDPKVVEKGFTVLEDWAFNNLLDPKEIEKERGVVLEESRLSKGSQERMSRQYFPLLFNGSQYGNRLPIGKDSILKTFTPQTLQNFYRQWYRPDLMAVIVVGDIEPEVAEAHIKAHFSKFSNPANAKPRPAVIAIKERTQPEALVVTDEEATNTILQIFNHIKPAKKVTTWADYRETVIEGLINSLINQRLQELTQKENPPFMYGATSTGQFLRGYDAFTSFAVLGNNTAQEAIDALVSETGRARQYGFLATELERAKSSLLNSAQMAYNERDKGESGMIVWQYVNHFLQGAPIPGAEARYNFLKSALPTITLDEVNAVAKNMPPTTNAFALITAPAKIKNTLPDNRALLNAVVAATSKPVLAYEEKAIAQQLMDELPAAGRITQVASNAKLGTTNLTLSNGITVTLKPTTYKNDQIMMDAWRWGGVQRFDLKDKMNAQTATQAVQVMGISEMSATELQKFLAGKTVSVQPYMNAHEEGIEGSSSVKDFETFLQLVHLYFTKPRKDPAAFTAFVKNGKGSIQYMKQSPQFFFQDTLMKIVYNNNPWMNQIPEEKDFESLSMDGALAVYNEVYANAHGMHFTFVGNLDSNAVKPLLERYLGSLPATPAEHKYKDNGIRPKKGIVQADIKRGKEAQSMITLMFHGETTYDRKEALALRGLLDVLNIQVTEKLREEMGGIYGGGFSGSIQKRPYVHYSITANLPCGPENVERLTAALMDLVKSAQKKGVSATDLAKVKETWKKQYDTQVQSNDFWLTGLSNSWIDRTDPEGMLTYKKRVDELTVADLQKAAKKYLNLNNYVKAVLYPEGVAATPAKPAKTF